jgi:hypothetical protein
MKKTNGRSRQDLGGIIQISTNDMFCTVSCRGYMSSKYSINRSKPIFNDLD